MACAIGYTLQYRVVAGVWTTINITTNTPTKAITGLSMSTAYEWRVRAKYPNATFSAYTSIATFSTLLPKQGLNIESASNDLHIFPNPATEKLNVEFPFSDDNAVIKIVNSLGQTMLEKNTNVNAEKGKRDIYIRVFSPDGAVMANSSSTFDYKGEETLFTGLKNIDYENTDLPVYYIWQRNSAFSKGKYDIEIYCAGEKIDSTSVILK